jgi:hypothetical protein
LRVCLETLEKRGGALAVAADDEHGVVAGDGADGLMQLSAIERFRECLRLTASCAKHDELLHALDSTEKRRGGTLESSARHLGTRRFETWPLICTISSAFHEAELRDVARDGGLRGVEASMAQPPSELFLAVQRFLIDDFEDDGLAACFHGEQTLEEYTIAYVAAKIMQ